MLRFIGIRWRLAGALFLTTCAIILALGFYLLEWAEGYYTSAITQILERESRAAGDIIRNLPSEDVPKLIKRIGHDLGHRITVIDSYGTVLADSAHDFRTMPNHADREEFKEALLNGYGKAVHHSSTIGTDMLYVATRHNVGDKTFIVRAAEPLSGLNEVRNEIKKKFLAAAIAAFFVSAIISIKLASSITNPIEGVIYAANKLAEGDLSARAPETERSIREISLLSRIFNDMAERLQNTISEINKQKSRMHAIFDSTDDGILMINTDNVVVMANKTAGFMFGVEADSLIGKTVIEGTLSHDLSKLVERVILLETPGTLEISFTSPVERTVDAYVTPIVSPEDFTGVLAVLHDTTAAKRLDDIRRDFAANVSHELKTPTASIKAMAETILIRRSGDEKIVEDFTRKIVEEADRMARLVEDLLSLAEIESQQRQLNLETFALSEPIIEVISKLREDAAAKNVELVANIQDGLVIKSDRDAITQILVNLVDNAIKYNKEGGRVEVSAKAEDQQIVIKVADSGIGIPKEDLPRVFERFYRVDKARSRQSGGTGLGLSIVKHLAEMLGGTITADSRLGEWSEFTINLPVEKLD